MLTIYSSAESLYCSKLRILLRYKQLTWQEIAPEGGCGSAHYRELISSGTMPAMVDGDVVIADSEAIAEYINEIQPAPPMLPESAVARAKCRERSRFHDTRLEPELRALFPHIGPNGKGSEIVRNQSEKISLRLAELSRLLTSDTHLDTSNLTLADCGFPVSFSWIDAFTPAVGLEIDWPADLVDYRKLLDSQPAVISELKQYRPAITAWVKSKGV